MTDLAANTFSLYRCPGAAKPWAAQLVARDIKFGFKRDFLDLDVFQEPVSLHSHSENCGSFFRGAIDLPGLYEFCEYFAPGEKRKSLWLYLYISGEWHRQSMHSGLVTDLLTALESGKKLEDLEPLLLPNNKMTIYGVCHREILWKRQLTLELWGDPF